MDRREFLGAVTGGTLAGVTGCLGGSKPARQAPPLVEDRPAAIYYPTHLEGMKMAGNAERSGYRCALTYTYPHRFWLVTGRRTEQVEIRDEDTVHLMPVVWETETGIVPPDVNPQVSITRDGSSIAQFAPWPMLSQPMGFHFGDNVALDGEGVYEVEVSIGSPSTRRTGALADNEGGVSFTFEFEFRRADLEEISYEDIPTDKEGTAGAVEPMSMGAMPSTQVPEPGDLPGSVRGTTESGDAHMVVTVLEDATRFGGDEGVYLAVSPRTRYNRYMLPLMSLSGRLESDGKAVYDDVLQAAIDPELRYHYGAAVPGIDSGDELTITVDAPPQAARHEGYETAFLDMPETTLTL